MDNLLIHFEKSILATKLLKKKIMANLRFCSRV